MEGVPRIPMLSYPMRRSADTPNFRPKFKNFISSHYNESPDAYTAEIEELQTLRASATHVSKDLTGCSTLKKYFCQLNFLKSRFPLHEGSPIAVTYSWYDIYSETVHGWADIDFEMSCVLYNIGALHTELGTLEARQTPEGMKVACTHFQCAAWAFQHLRHNYPKFFTPDLSPDLLSVIYNICLGQAQECILEKSLIDNRKSTITAKVALQIVEYYQLALQTCEQMFKDSSQYSDKFLKAVKKWKKLVELKISYYSSMGFLYRGFQSEDQQKWGERVTFFRAAKEKLEAAFKLAKAMEKTDSVHDTLTFTLDVIVGKLTVSEKDNEFIYHDKIPDLDAISSDIKGVSLVKAIPFKFDDPSIAGPDIFGRLVPIEAHEASSLYSEEKAKVLRTYSARIEEKNEGLDKFLIALQLDHLDLHSNELKIPQELIDCCAALSVNKDAVKVLSGKMSNLSGRFHDVESNLNEVLQLLKDEEAQEREYQEIVGKRSSSNVLTELSREAHKYQHAQTLASESNQTLHEVMKAHVSNMNILIQPLDEVLKHIPSASDIEQKDEESIYEMKRLACKVDEMRKQRQSLENQLRDSIHSDDITKSLVVKKDQDLDVVFKEELKKHDHITQVLDQNLLAQENIMRALTETNAKYAETRIATVEVLRNRNQAIQSLLSSYEAYDELLVKCEKGIQFYGTLDENVSKLLQRVKSVCAVQNEEREQTKKLLQPKPTTIPPPSSFSSYANPNNDPYNAMQSLPNPLDLPPVKTAVGGTGKLKDYLSRRKAQQAVAVEDASGQGQRAPYSGNATNSAQYQQYQYPKTTATSTPASPATNYGQHNGSQYPSTSGAQNQNYSAQQYSAYSQGQGQYYQYNAAGTSGTANQYGGSGTTAQNQTPNQYVSAGTANPSVGQSTAVSTSYQYPAAQQQQQPQQQYSTSYSAAAGYGQGQQGQYPSSTTNANNKQTYSNAGQYQSSVSTQQPYSGQQQQQYPGSTAASAGQGQQYSYPQTQTTVASYQQPQPQSQPYGSASAYYTPAAAVSSAQNSTPYYHQQQQQPTAATHAVVASTAGAATNTYAQQQPQQYAYNNAYNQYYTSQQQQQPVATTNTTTTYTQPQYSTGIDSTGGIEKQKYLSTYDKPTYPQYGAQQQQGSYGQYSYYGQQQQSQPTAVAGSYGTPSQTYANTSQTATPYGQQQQQPTTPYAATTPYANATAPIQQQSASAPYANPAQQQTYTQQQQQGYQQQQQSQQQVYNYGGQNSTPVTNVVPQQQPRAPVTSSKNLDLLADIDLSGAQVMPLAPVICHSTSATSTSSPQKPDLPRPHFSEINFPTATVSEPVLSVQEDNADAASPQPKIQLSSSNTEIPASLLNGSKKQVKVDPLGDPAVLSKFSIEVEKLNHLIEAFHKKSLNGPTNLDLKWRELLDIQNAESVKRSISVARCYPMKNRFPDILPYDQSRVPLPSTKDDYINASFLKDLSPSAIPFIATQAPLPVTFADFWHMIWHYSVELIVCLTNEADLKGHIYWPVEKGKDLDVGPFKISLQTCNVKPTATFIERIMTVCHRDLKQTRVVIHLQFTEWGGNVFPISPAPLLSFVNEVHSFYEQQRNLKRPVVLHCIAGVGKTGVFSTLSSALKEINSGNGIIDLITCAGTACEQRKGLMIDKEYLRFTYHCLLYYCQDLLMKRGILSARTTFDKKPKVHTHTRHPSQDFLSDPFKKMCSNENLVPSSTGSTNADETQSGTGSGSDAKDVTSSGESSRCSSYTSSPIRTITKQNKGIYSDVPSSLTNVDPGTFRQITNNKEKEILKVDVREAFESGKGALLDRKTEDDPFDPLSSLDPLWTIKK